VYVAVFVEVCVADLTDNRALHLRRSVTSHLESYTCVPNSILYITNSIILHTNIFIREPCISQIRHVSPRVICVSRTRILHVTNSIICATNYHPAKHLSKFATPHLLSYVCHEFVSHMSQFLLYLSRTLSSCTLFPQTCHVSPVVSQKFVTNSYYVCHKLYFLSHELYHLRRSTPRLICCNMPVTNPHHLVSVSLQIHYTPHLLSYASHELVSYVPRHLINLSLCLRRSATPHLLSRVCHGLVLCVSRTLISVSRTLSSSALSLQIHHALPGVTCVLRTRILCVTSSIIDAYVCVVAVVYVCV